MASTAGALERMLGRDRLVVLAALALITALAWAYTLAGAGMNMTAAEMTHASWLTWGEPAREGMSTSPGMPAPASHWTPGYAALMLAMWWAMMVAMMLPSAAPTILLAAALNRRASRDRPPYGSTAFFIAGYLACWLFFSVAAVAAQWILTESGLLSEMLRSRSHTLSAGLLAVAGLWQLSPLKHACLRHCRSPVDFLVRHRRSGNAGAMLTGIGHGTYCLGCCWLLMALLFVGGVMDLYWIAGLALLVMAEKALPGGKRLAHATGAALVTAATALALA